MKIALVEDIPGKRNNVARDCMGGYGQNNQIGNSLLSKIITRTKKKKRNVPFFLLGYLASIFEGNGHSIIVVNDEDPPLDVDLIVISTSIADCKNEREFAKRMKEERKEAKVGLIGTFGSVMPDYYEDSCDFIILGEPEKVIMSITDSNIPEGRVISEPIKDLDSLPFPNWDHFKLERFDYKPILLNKPVIPMLTSRGCIFSCDYCGYPVFYKPYRKRSPENVIDEIRYIKERYNARSIVFRDPLFTADKKRARQISELIISNHLNDGLEWTCETRLDFLDNDLVDILHESGLRGIHVGIETSNTDILSKTGRKPVKIVHQDNMVDYCYKKGVHILCFYVLGLDDDTKETILETIEYAKKLNTIVAQFHINTPLPGTGGFEKMKHKIYEKDWSKFTFYDPVFTHDNLSREDLIKLKEKAWNSYYLRYGYIRRYFWDVIKTLVS